MNLSMRTLYIKDVVVVCIVGLRASSAMCVCVCLRLVIDAVTYGTAPSPSPAQIIAISSHLQFAA